MIGQQTILQAGRSVPTSADGVPEYKPGGVTIDWTTVPANGSDTTLTDGTVVKSGTKYLPFGVILCQITQAEIQTVTITGAPTGGTFTLTFGGQTTSALAYNASAAAVQAALEALSTIGAGNVVVSGSAGGPYTVTFAGALLNIAQMTTTGSFTGGTSPAIAVTTGTQGNASFGMFGPYDAGATDGRQTLTRGQCYILNYTVVQTDPHADTAPGVFEGGLIFPARVKKLVSGAYVAGWDSGTVAPAFPRIRLAQ